MSPPSIPMLTPSTKLLDLLTATNGFLEALERLYEAVISQSDDNKHVRVYQLDGMNYYLDQLVESSTALREADEVRDVLDEVDREFVGARRRIAEIAGVLGAQGGEEGEDGVGLVLLGLQCGSGMEVFGYVDRIEVSWVWMEM